MSIITIKPGAAVDDAVQIDNIVSTIQRDMEELDNAISFAVPNRIQTSWSEELAENWSKYYSSDIPESMEQMKASAGNLRVAVQQSLEYDKPAE